MNVSIRPMTEQDLAASSRIKTLAFRLLYAGHVSDERVEQYLDKACSITALKTRLVDPARRLIVAELDGQIIGGAILDIKGDVGYLNSVWVDPAYRREGVGMQLALWREQQAVSEGCTRFELHVWDRNNGVRRFATDRGYERTDETLYDELTDSVLELYAKSA